MTQPPYTSSCKCGQVRFEAASSPAFNVVCYCTDCQAAGAALHTEMGCEAPCEADGGTSYSSFLEKDWHCVSGEDKIRGHKLKPDSPSTRYVASCCQTPLYLNYAPGFWVSTYRKPFTNALPPMKWRIKTSDRTSDLPYPDNIPRFKGFPLRLYGALLKAKWRR